MRAVTPEVVDLLRQLRPAIEACPRLALLSPGTAERALFPCARVLYREDWDLGQARRDLRFDLIIACHVFHYAPEPRRWFDNVTASCRALLIADLVQRKRSPEAEFGRDGDCMRYTIGRERPSAPRQFDLNAFGDRVLAHHAFAGAPNEYGPARHFLALIRGRLDAPLLQLHGYAPAERADTLIERALSEGLGVQLNVPAAQAPGGLFALFVRHAALEPVLHGLAAAPANLRERCAAWLGCPPAAAVMQLAAAKRAAEASLARAINTYASNVRVGQDFAAQLAALELDLCLTPRGVACSHPRRLSHDFAGRARSYSTAPAADLLALDLAQETRAHGEGCPGWGQLMAAIATQRSAARTRIANLARWLPRLAC
jgi:hypothetical protein